MAGGRSSGKKMALGCGGLILVLAVLLLATYTILQFIGARQVRSALARVKASGAPTTWEEVIPPPVPDEENAAVVYEKAFAAIQLTPDVGSPRGNKTGTYTLITNYLSAPTRKDRKALEEEVRGVLAENADALALAREAAKRPMCRFDWEWSDPIGVPMTELAGLKDLTKLTCAQAQFLADRGDLPGALRAWSVAIALADHLESDPRFMAELLRYAMVGIASPTLRQILQDSEPTPEQCRATAAALRQLDLSGSFVRTLEVERLTQLFCLRRARDDPHGFAEATGGSGVTLTVRWLGYRAVSRLDEAAMLQSWERQISLARRPYRETIAQFRTLEHRPAPRYALVTRGLEFAAVSQRAALSRDRSVAKVGLMRTALGLAAYRTRFGAYPDSLDQLREAFDWGLPEDPFSGRDFVYGRRGAGYLLYSLNRDLDDDGGKPLGRAHASDPYDGDLPWRVER